MKYVLTEMPPRLLDKAKLENLARVNQIRFTADKSKTSKVWATITVFPRITSARNLLRVSELYARFNRFATYYSINFQFIAVRLEFIADRLEFISDRLRFIGAGLGFIGDRLRFIGAGLGFIGDRLGFIADKLEFSSDKLRFTAAKPPPLNAQPPMFIASITRNAADLPPFAAKNLAQSVIGGD